MFVNALGHLRHLNGNMPECKLSTCVLWSVKVANSVPGQNGHLSWLPPYRVFSLTWAFKALRLLHFCPQHTHSCCLPWLATLCRKTACVLLYKPTLFQSTSTHIFVVRSTVESHRLEHHLSWFSPHFKSLFLTNKWQFMIFQNQKLKYKSDLIFWIWWLTSD